MRRHVTAFKRRGLIKGVFILAPFKGTDWKSLSRGDVREGGEEEGRGDESSKEGGGIADL